MDTREIAVAYRLAHWAGILRERQASGRSIRAYCKSEGICENVYYYWQRKLREAACQESNPAEKDKSQESVVPSGWTAICEPTHDAATEQGTVSIEIGKCCVKVDSGVSVEQLEKVCRVLMKLC